MQAHPKMIWLQVSVHNTILKSYGTNIVGMGSGATHRLTKELAVTLAINDEHRLRTAFPLGAAAGDLLQRVSHFTPCKNLRSSQTPLEMLYCKHRLADLHDIYVCMYVYIYKYIYI